MSAEARLRLTLGGFGALAGLALHLLTDVRPEPTAFLPLRLAAYFALAFFGLLAALAGPIRPMRATAIAAGVALGLALLATWASLRFGTGRPWFDPARGLLVGPFVVLTAALVPLVMAGGWRDFAPLFAHFWATAIRVAIALAFLGLFWLVYWLSDTLLRLVGIDILRQISREEALVFLLSGAVLGLALAVTQEFARVIDTALDLVLRLLRLLVIPITAVLWVFLAAVLVQGLDDTFRRASAAGTMLAMSIGALILCIAVIERDAASAPGNRWMVWAARLTAAVLPLTCAIAAYALWLRVAEYGWTPERVLAALAAGVAAAGALPVAATALLGGTGWRDRARTGLGWALAASVALGLLWFTPLLNAQRISAQSQLARLADGRIDAAKYDFWPLAREWGAAGTTALAAFQATGPGPEVAARIAVVREADNKYQAISETEARFGTGERRRIEEAAQRWRQLRATAATLPAGAQLPPHSALSPSAQSSFRPHVYARACDETDIEGRPRCLAVQRDFLTGVDGSEWLIVAQRSPSDAPTMVLFKRGAEGWEVHELVRDPIATPAPDLIAEIAAGRFTPLPAPVTGLSVGPVRILPQIPARTP